MTTTHDVQPSDENRHTPGEDNLWNESYYCDFVTYDRSMGGWLRLGLYPNLGVAWWTAWIVRPGRPGICSVDFHMPVPEGRSLVAASNPESSTSASTDMPAELEIKIETPLTTFRLVVPQMSAKQFERPEDAYTDTNWMQVQASLDLTWTTDGIPYHYDVSSRYEIPCLVAGTITIDDESHTVHGQGQRDHSWGVRNWWRSGWCWSSMRLEDGTRTHMSDTRAPGATGYFGYIQTPGVAHSLTALKSSEKLGDHGFPTIARIDMAAGGTDSGEPPVHTQLDIGIDVTPVAFGPVLLRNDQDGRLSRFPRAMVECKTDDGRTGAGWIEWNQPEGP